MKIYYENGIKYYFSGVSNNRCIKIEVEDWVTTMVFKSFEDAMYVDYCLKDLNNSFPNIINFKIEYGVSYIEISNYSFPNVRIVVSDVYRYKSNVPYLIESNELTNSFCLKKNEVLDLDGISTIKDYALEGCMTDKVINMRNDIYLHVNALHGSCFVLNKLNDNRMKHFGNYAINANTDSDILIMPDDMHDVTDLKYVIDDIINKTLVIHRAETLESLATLESNYRYENGYTYEFLKKLIIHADVSISNMTYLLNNTSIKEVELDDHNPYLKEKDSVIYSKDGSVLYRCLKQKLGEVIIPDCVTTIAYGAFQDCNKITSIIIPDSVTDIGNRAFSGCKNLKYIKFSKNVTELQDALFYRCENLEIIDSVGTIKEIGKIVFYDCVSLKSEISLRDCLKIGEKAFKHCLFMKNAYINNTSLIQKDALNNFLNIYLNDNFLGYQSKSMFDAIFENPNDTYNYYYLHFNETGLPDDLNVVNIYLNDKHVCLPKCLNMTNRKYLEQNMDVLFSDEFTDDVEFKMFQAISKTEIKREIIFIAYKFKQTKPMADYLKRVAKQIAFDHIELKDEDAIIRLVDYGWLSNKSIDELIPKLQEYEMNIALAYLLDMKNKNSGSKSSFRL